VQPASSRVLWPHHLFMLRFHLRSGGHHELPRGTSFLASRDERNEYSFDVKLRPAAQITAMQSISTGAAVPAAGKCVMRLYATRQGPNGFAMSLFRVEEATIDP
jgi:hypothetical protein